MKKKLIFLLMIFICISFNVYADGYAERSEIRAYIDYTPIESYIINGYTYISADDLVNYGFEVAYDNDTRSLNVSRIRYATPYYSREMWESSTKEKHRAKIENTDIKVFLDGEETDCFYADGKILIMIDSLAKYGAFEWNQYQKTVSVTVFQNELEYDLNNADNVVEIAIDEKTSYIGQVNEDNLPDGIGCRTYTRDPYDKIKYLGYFTNGKPNGLVYKETFHTVSRSYTNRYLHFIGETDGTKESKREYINDSKFATTTLIREPNFGFATLPIQQIEEWTGPEILPDRTIYNKGCYYERIGGKRGDHEYIIWGDGNGAQTMNHICLAVFEGPKTGLIDYREFEKLRVQNPKIKYSTEFSEYYNLQKTFHKGAIHTASEAPTVLNSPDDGATQIENGITVFVNGEEVLFSVNPVIINDRVLVPLRAIFQKLGARVDWNDKDQSIEARKGDIRILLTIGSKEMFINNELHELDVEPILKYDRTLVPLRAVAEAFNAEVSWDESKNRVDIITEQ